ncbi:MAG: N-methyl-D-aspartate receptor NMDAR2C subunit [Planctomycetia bacterium]|nr:N-methyl-D-aspartate receptor NMDAR2C subunit [Planctomycetia bacterium]
MIDQDRWAAEWKQLNGQPDTDLFDELVRRYEEPHRAYHTLQHLRECFTLLDVTRETADRPHEVELALWFHDAIYDTHRSDNEEQSADLAERSMLAGRVDPASVQRVKSLIMATKHEQPCRSRDEAVLTDIDLAILGSGQKRFAEYERQIRVEYSWVPDQQFRDGRTAILRRFLERDPIFNTVPFRERFEVRAKENLAASIRMLELFNREEH